MTLADIRCDSASLQKMFRDYVGSTNFKPRHTKEAYNEVVLLCEFLNGAFPNNPSLRDTLYEHMMDCAVEFEESGFIAGVRFALGLSTEPVQPSNDGSSPSLPVTPDEVQTAFHGNTQGEQNPSGTPSPVDADKSPANAGKVNTPAFISTRQISELFEASHAKIVKRIEDTIMPRLDKQTRKYFQMEIEYTKQHRRYKVYYLNRTACELYMEEMEGYKKYVNIAGGLVKMRELMKVVFPVENGES